MEHRDEIHRRGLRHNPGGFLGFHSHEAGVCLVLEGDCTTDFNPAVVLSDHPLGVAVEASKLDPKLLAADLNALLDPSVVFAARADGVDLCDPKT